MIKKRVNANAPTLARLAPACVLLYNVISHSHSKRKCSTLMLSSSEPLHSARPENGGCKPLLCGLLCSDNCHFPSFSVIFCHFLTPAHDYGAWLWLQTPTSESDSWLQLLTPTPDSDSWLQLLTPTPDSESWHLYAVSKLVYCKSTCTL